MDFVHTLLIESWTLYSVGMLLILARLYVTCLHDQASCCIAQKVIQPRCFANMQPWSDYRDESSSAHGGFRSRTG